MRSICFDDYELFSESAFMYVTHKMLEMVEQERETVKDLSCYRWIIGTRVAKSIFPKRPTKIFGYDVVYGDPVKFYCNGVDFKSGVINPKDCSNCRFGNDGICKYINKCVKTSIDPAPTHWQEMTDAQKLEKIMSNKKLIGDISNGYSYANPEMIARIEESKRRAEHGDMLDAMRYSLENNQIMITDKLKQAINSVYWVNGISTLHLRRLADFCNKHSIAWDNNCSLKDHTCTFDFVTKNGTLYGCAKKLTLEEVMSDTEKVQDDLIEYIKHEFNIDFIDYSKMYVKKEDKDMSKLCISELLGRFSTTCDKPHDLIKNVVFSGPCTIVKWSDGDKTIVRCENEDFDKEKGLAMAIVKKFFGTNESKSNYNDIFKKWIQEEKEESSEKHDVIEKAIEGTRYMSIKEFAKKAGVSESTIRRQVSKGQYSGAKKVDGKWMIPVGEV